VGYVLCMLPPSRTPDWDRLFETAAAQSGYVTTKQAAEAGYSTHLLRKHIHAGRVTRPHRGIYRLVHFPPGEHEELVTAWLWSERAGVFSHQTALSLHGLSDVLPAQIHLTLPEAWRRRRFRVPAGVVLHHADVAPEEQSWFGPVPATSARRTLSDCAKSALSPELVRQAAQQALRRGLVTKSELADVETALKPFGRPRRMTARTYTSAESPRTGTHHEGR
jgi:predicted transcriptional regulator of viral defense system